MNGCSDVPHTGANLGNYVSGGTRVWVAQRKKRPSLSWLHGGATSAGIVNASGSSLLSLDELLATTRTVRSWSRLMCTSTVGSKMGVVDCRNWMMLATS